MSKDDHNGAEAQLARLTPEEFRLLDATSREAEKELEAMACTLDATNAKLDAVFAEMERLRVRRETGA